MKSLRNTARSAFTLVEMLVVSLVLAIVVSFVVVAAYDALVNSEIASARAKAEGMNKAIQSARIDGLTPPFDTVDATHDWLVSHHYLRPESL